MSKSRPAPNSIQEDYTTLANIKPKSKFFNCSCFPVFTAKKTKSKKKEGLLDNEFDINEGNFNKKKQ